ncbi:MAG: hypothetical protein M1825_000386 [Sarcosagium campestre]|nr:MAG: hypothetical protein M1825_000386 [Sarcosagium campestre]
MAANYWVSTQRLHWQFSRDTLFDIRKRLEDGDRGLVQQYPVPDRRLLSIFFKDQITKLGRRLNMRQQAMATAQLYVRRFYTKVELRKTNPYLILATALYLAGKMEECPQHIRLVVTEARNAWPDLVTTDIAKLGECEFSLISEMNSQLIVHHPYRTLSDLQSILSLSQDEASLAWSVVNDHYLTDLPLLYPPHIIAVTATFLTLVLKPSHTGSQSGGTSASSVISAIQAASNGATPSPTSPSSGGAKGAQPSNGPPSKVQMLVSWTTQSEMNIEEVIDSTQEIISLYEVWEQYNERVCKEQINRFVRGRGLDK